MESGNTLRRFGRSEPDLGSDALLSVRAEERQDEEGSGQQHSASRAIAILRAMNLRPVSSVANLAAETGISKPSIVRLLAILMEDEYVERAAKPGTYMLTREVLRLSNGFQEGTALGHAAGPVLEDLTKLLEWPAALGMFEKDEMVIRYSTIPSSQLSWYRTTLYYRLALLESAMGLAYLAFSRRTVRDELLKLVLVKESASTPDRSEGRFDLIRQRGYALRLPTLEHPTTSLSVPLVLGEHVAACVSMTVFARSMSVETAVDRFLDPMRAAAAQIVELSRPVIGAS